MSLMSDKCWVTMTDKCLSGWGMAKGKINKLVLECDSVYEAEFVSAKAESRPEMKYVNIAFDKPYFNPTKYLVSYKTKQDAPAWYRK